MGRISTTDRSQQEALQQLHRRQRARDLSDLQAVLKLPEGKRVLGRLLAMTRQIEPLYRQSSEVYAVTAQYDLGLQVREWLNEATPDVDLLIIRERREQERKDRKEFHIVADASASGEDEM